MLSEVEKGLLLAEAGYQCEYCKKLLQDVSYQLEHIWPESRGGETNRENLAISCQRCNTNKGNHTEWIDHTTGASFPLFHPRRMNWDDHFKKNLYDIVGISPIGRATSALLFRSTSQYLPIDLQWEPIEGLYENRPIYYFLNHLRYRRLRNDFDTLYKQLIGPLPEVDISPTDLKITQFAKDMLLLELFFTRSRPNDVTSGINYVHQLLVKPDISSYQKKQFESFLSILYQQRSTLNFEAGDIKAAAQDQNAAYKFFIKANDYKIDSEIKSDNPSALASFLRSQTILAKYAEIDLSSTFLQRCFNVISGLDPFYSTSHYSYLIDLVMLNPSPSLKLIEQLYEQTSNILSTEGYGTSTDQAKLITLRRRWWILHVLIEKNPNYDSLLADLKLWEGIKMFNELRELKTYIMRIRPRLNEKDYTDLMHMIKNK